MSAIVDFKISQQAVREYADEVRGLERELKEKEVIIKELKRKLSELYKEIGEMGAMTDEMTRDYGPPYGPHNPAGNEKEKK